MYYISSTKYTLQERKTKKNGTVYDVVFRVTDEEGHTKQKKLSGYSSKTDAKRGYTAFVTDNCELRRGTLKTVKESPSEAPERTIKELLPEYLASLGNKNKGSTAYDKENVFRLFVTPNLGDLKPSELTRTVLYDWQEKLWSSVNPRTGKYYSHKYLTKTRAHLSSFLRWMQDKYGVANHLSEIAVPKAVTPPKTMQFWTVEEFGKFIETVDDPTYHAIFVFAFFTGRRKGELLALAPKDITPKAITWNKSLTRKTNNGQPWQITTTKANKTQTLPYAEAVHQELKQYKPQGKFVFGGEKSLGENMLRRYMDAHAAIAGVKKIRFHDLRHSFVSMLIHEGANITVVADLIGDTVQQVEKTYAHMYVSDRESALGKLPKSY